MQLPDTATLDHAAALAATLPAAVAQSGAAFSVDASALKSFDSATIALLMQARRAANAAGKGFELVGLPPKLAQLARLYGVADLLGLPAPETASGGSAPG
jgi:phospholipid transport system transporter-binding protein